MLLEDMPIAAIKVGTMASLEQVAAIAEIVSDYADVPLILDPFTVRPARLRHARRRHADPDPPAAGAAGHVLMLSQPELARFADCWRDPGSIATVAEDVAELTGFGCGHVLVTGIGGGDGARANNLYDPDGLAVSLSWAAAPARPLRRRRQHAVGRAGGAHGARRWTRPRPCPTPRTTLTGALQHACRFGMGRLIPNKTVPDPGAPARHRLRDDHAPEQP